MSFNLITVWLNKQLRTKHSWFSPKSFFAVLLRKWNKNSKILPLIAVVLLCVLIFFFKEEIQKLQAYGYAGLFLLNVFGSATLFLPTPLFLTSVSAATFLNPILVVFISAAGSAIGETSGYLLGKSGNYLVDDNHRFKRIKNWIDRWGSPSLIFLSAIPNPFFDIAGIVSGITEIPYYKFLTAVFLGKVIKFTLIVLAGVNIFKILVN